MQQPPPTTTTSTTSEQSEQPRTTTTTSTHINGKSTSNSTKEPHKKYRLETPNKSKQKPTRNLKRTKTHKELESPKKKQSKRTIERPPSPPIHEMSAEALATEDSEEYDEAAEEALQKATEQAYAKPAIMTRSTPPPAQPLLIEEADAFMDKTIFKDPLAVVNKLVTPPKSPSAPALFTISRGALEKVLAIYLQKLYPHTIVGYKLSQGVPVASPAVDTYNKYGEPAKEVSATCTVTLKIGKFTSGQDSKIYSEVTLTGMANMTVIPRQEHWATDLVKCNCVEEGYKKLMLEFMGLPYK